MKRSDLDEALSRLASQPCPEIDPNWQTDVMRRVRTHGATPEGGFGLRDLFLPHLSLNYTSLTVALAVTLGIGAVVGWLRPMQPRPVAQSNSPMAIFSADSPDLPATLMLADR